MNMERIKSLILAVLVVSNIVLSNKIWSNKKLWPSGYNFFVTVRNSFIIKSVSKIFNHDNIDYVSKAYINTPKQIIINTGYQTTRFVLDRNHDMFDNANIVSQDILTLAFSASSRSISSVTQEEWYSVLMSKSMYLNYNVEYDTHLFAQFFNVNETELAYFTSYITDIVISADTSSPYVSVYIKNGHDNSYFKINTSVSKEETENIIGFFQNENHDDDSEESFNIVNYSFDLQFDQGNQKVLLSPMIPIFNNPQEYNIIESVNPIMKSDGSLNSFVAERLFNIFNINPNAVRRYTEANGTFVFVENDATLKISPIGVLEYSAIGNGSDIKLYDVTPSSYTNICMAADFMDSVNSQISANKNLYLSSNLTADNISDSNLELTFDYSVCGLPVNIAADNVTHAVSMTVSDGYLKKYTQLLRAYSDTDKTDITNTLIEALDDTVNQYSDTENQIYVDNIYAAYNDDGSLGEKNAVWNVSLDNTRSQ